MTIKHRSQLVQLMKHLKLPLRAIELGTAQGLFSCDLLEDGLDVLYSIDAWQKLNQTGDGGFEQQWHDENFVVAQNNLAKYGDRSVILKGLTSDIAPHIKDNYFGLVNVDADHRYEGVKADIENYYPKLVHGGIMCFHDFIECDTYGVKRAVYEFAMHNGLNVITIPENAIADTGAYFLKR